VRLFFLFLIIFFSPLFLFSQEKRIPVTVKGDKINFLQGGKEIEARGNVVIRYKEVKIFCDRAIYYSEKNRVYAKGKVRVEDKQGILLGEEMVYDFDTQRIEVKRVKIETPPLYIVANEGEKRGDNEYILRRGYLTTCSPTEPCYYKLTARKVKIYPREKVVAKDVFLRLGEIPIFYLPYYYQSLKDKFPLELSAGKDKEWGYYLLTRWRYYFNEGNKGKLILDYYQERGWGKGITYKFTFKDYGEGFANVYHIQDELYENREALFRKYPQREDIASKYLKEKRYKITTSYKWNFFPNLSLTSEFNKFSDENFMKDFFYRQYEIEPHPYSYALLDYRMSKSSLSLLLRKRSNHFWTETEYLPQLEFNLYRSPLYGNFYFESKTQLGNLNFKNAHSDVDFDALRFHSHNTLSAPVKIAWLSINPYVGQYTTFYSKDSSGNEKLWRQVPEGGVNLATKLYKVFPANFSLLGERIDWFRHIVTPTFTYTYIHPPTVAKERIFQFDSIDSLERLEKIVFQLDSKLQAKNKERAWDFLYFSPSAEYKLHQEGKGSFLDNIKADLEVYPIRGVSFNADTKYDVPIRKITAFNTDLTLRDFRQNKYSLSLGHRYARNDSSQGTMSLYYKISPKLEIKSYLRYEYTTNSFKEQQYRLRRYLPCKWIMDLGVDVDENRDTSLWIIFTLGPFPGIHFGFDHTYHGARSEY